jgi:hypothetical protein
MTLSAGSSSANDGGLLSMSAGASSGGDGGILSLSGGTGSVAGGDVSIKGGNTTSSVYAYGVNGGHVNITSGSAQNGYSGSLTLSAGNAVDAGLGGTITLQGGASPWVGSNIILRPGVGDIYDGILRFETRSNFPFGILSEQEIEFTVRETFDIVSKYFYVNAYRVLFNTVFGVNVGDGPLHGFAYATGNTGLINQVDMNSQMGIITVPVLDYYESSVTLTVFNIYATSHSIAFVTVVSADGTFCQPKVKRSTCLSGKLVIELYDYYGSECTNDAKLGFFLVIP